VERPGARVLALVAALASSAVGAARAQEPGAGIVARYDAASLLRELPSARDAAALLETVEPLAIVDRLGGAGLSGAEPRFFSLHGTSWTQNVFVIDGADASDPARGGAPLLVPDVDALQRLDGASALTPAEQGSPGVVVGLVPREPESRWNGGVQGFGVPASAFQGAAAGAPPAIAHVRSLVDASASASGPIDGDRLRLLLATRVVHLLRLERADPLAREERLLSGTLRLTFRAGDRSAFRLLGAAQAIARPLAAAPDLGSASREDARAGGLTLSFTRRGERAAFSAYAGSWTAATTPRDLTGSALRRVERLEDGPIPLLVFPSRAVRSVWSGGATMSVAPAPGPSLTLAPSVGVQLQRAASSEAPGAPVSLAETVGGLPARVWDYAWTASDSQRHALALAAWVGERVAWRDRLRVDAGLRLERTSGAARGAAAGVSWTSLVPRVTARLRALDAGRLTLLAGYAAYRHRLLLDWLAFGDPAAPQASVYRWNDGNGDGRFDPAERGVLVARVGPGGGLAAIDPGLRPPRTREWVVGLTAVPAAGWALSLLGFDRAESELLAAVDVGAPASAYDVRYVPDPGGDIVGAEDDQLLPVFDRRPESFGRDRYLLTNASGPGTRHQALELRVEKTLGARLALQAGATASRTVTDGAGVGFRVNENDPGVVGAPFDDANASVYARGRGFFDRAFTIKLAGVFRAPGDLRLGVVARYQDGQPFARIVVVPDLGQGPEPVQATTRGETAPTGARDPQGRPLLASGHRFSYTATVDARLEKGVRFGRPRGALIAEVFNLLGAANEVEEDPVWGPRFRVPTALQPPRTFRLGARLDF